MLLAVLMNRSECTVLGVKLRLAIAGAERRKLIVENRSNDILVRVQIWFDFFGIHG